MTGQTGLQESMPQNVRHLHKVGDTRKWNQNEQLQAGSERANGTKKEEETEKKKKESNISLTKNGDLIIILKRRCLFTSISPIKSITFFC